MNFLLQKGVCMRPRMRYMLGNSASHLGDEPRGCIGVYGHDTVAKQCKKQAAVGDKKRQTKKTKFSHAGATMQHRLDQEQLVFFWSLRCKAFVLICLV